MDKIIITRSMHPFVAKKLSIHHNVWQNTSSSPITRKELLKRMARCNGLLCTPYDVIDSEIIDAAPDLRTISTFSVGYATRVPIRAEICQVFSQIIRCRIGLVAQTHFSIYLNV